MRKISTEQALHRLAAYCSRAERCIFDLRRKMDAWEIASDEQNKIIQQLIKEKFLDESRYCRAFVNDKSKYNHWGKNKIRFELKKKQIPEFLIREAIEDIDLAESKKQLLYLIERKRKSVKGKDEFEIKQKLMRFAVGRGFSQAEIEWAFGI
jgi:regulatory protein